MIPVFEADTRLDAWIRATEHLLMVGMDFNVILEINSPADETPRTKAASKLVDAFYDSHPKNGKPVYPLHTIAETIFPGWEYQHKGLKGMFKAYNDETYPIIRSGTLNSWGTYAHRLMHRRTSVDKTINPLEELIKRMKSQKSHDGSKRSCYEIGITEGEFDISLYSPEKDAKVIMKAPCLSHVSFKLRDGVVHLTALYRSHDYTYKALGNILGLARLLECVARETELQIGSLVVHSTYAFTSGSKTKLETLLKDIKKIEGV